MNKKFERGSQLQIESCIPVEIVKSTNGPSIEVKLIDDTKVFTINESDITNDSSIEFSNEPFIDDLEF